MVDSIKNIFVIFPSVKLDPIKRADILILRGLGYSTTEIAEKLNISPQLVSYYLSNFKRRAEEVGAHWAFIEVLLQAGPAYPLFSVLSRLKLIRGGKNDRR